MSKLLLALLLLFTLTACAATPTTLPATSTPTLIEQDFTGTLVAGEWTKTEQSYCQGGSDYFVLVSGADEYLLNSFRDLPYAADFAARLQAQNAQFSELAGQTVTLRGVRMTRTYSHAEHCPDPNAQCVDGSLTCEWIRVREVKTP